MKRRNWIMLQSAEDESMQREAIKEKASCVRILNSRQIWFEESIIKQKQELALKTFSSSSTLAHFAKIYVGISWSRLSISLSRRSKKRKALEFNFTSISIWRCRVNANFCKNHIVVVAVVSSIALTSQAQESRLCKPTKAMYARECMWDDDDGVVHGNL